MPHTWIVWVRAQIVHSHIAIQEMSAIRSSSCTENFHIFLEGLRKHFQYVCYLSNSTTNLSKFSETNNTLRDIVRREYKKSPSATKQKAKL